MEFEDIHRIAKDRYFLLFKKFVDAKIKCFYRFRNSVMFVES